MKSSRTRSTIASRFDKSKTQIRWKSKPWSCFQVFTYCVFGLTCMLSGMLLLVINKVTFPGMTTSVEEEVGFFLKPAKAVLFPAEAIIGDDVPVTVIENTPQLETPKISVAVNATEIFYAVDSSGMQMAHIAMIQGGKTGLRQNMRVIMTAENNGALTRPGSDADKEMRKLKKEKVQQFSGVLSLPGNQPWALQEATRVLRAHPLLQPESPVYRGNGENGASLEEAMIYIKNQPVCKNMPIFLTMATVGDDLYWQLIENFVFSMVKFEISDCSLVICVSDAKCMNLCRENSFPCFNYQSDKVPLPSVMEQIGGVKLFHIPKAMAKGVDVFMLDLDVGFLADPRGIVKTFNESPDIDIFVQEDFIFIMDRKIWLSQHLKIWFTDMLPNIGLFLCRGNEKTAKVFSLAWSKYDKMEGSESKKNPGKDQNHVLEGMRIGRVKWGLRYAYFPNYTAPLLDKMTRVTANTVELGGEAASGVLDPSGTVAMHTTCYEHVTKVLGLKATNAFWNPKYYDPRSLTITKQIIFIDEKQLLDEIRSLVWLALHTGSTLIIPNILGSPEGTPFQHKRAMDFFRGQSLWPAYRVAFFKRLKGQAAVKVNIAEPAFYWRINRDYDDPPEPTILFFNPKKNLEIVRKSIEEKRKNGGAERIVLHSVIAYPSSISRSKVLSSQKETRVLGAYRNVNQDNEVTRIRVAVWANDSVGTYSESFAKELRRYGQIPSLKASRYLLDAQKVIDSIRNCENIFGAPRGNRTCFQICD